MSSAISPYFGWLVFYNVTAGPASLILIFDSEDGGRNCLRDAGKQVQDHTSLTLTPWP
jgi:hypothetical protein